MYQGVELSQLWLFDAIDILVWFHEIILQFFLSFGLVPDLKSKDLIYLRLSLT